MNEIITINSNGHPVLHFDALMKMIKTKTKRDPRCWDKGHDGHYDRWEKKMGYNKSHVVSINQARYREYKADPEGYVKEPPYLDYWHIWLQWVKPQKNKRFKVPSTVNFFKFWHNMKAANGIVPETHEFLIAHVRKAAATLDEIEGPALIHQYEKSFKLDYELDWALELTDQIMGWIGPEYWNKNLMIKYNH